VDAFDPVAAATPRGMFLLTGGVPEEDSCKVNSSTVQAVLAVLAV